MNDQTKKLTNLGIIFAVVGFTMVGGALVLIPNLVDEKVKSIRSIDIEAGTGHAAESQNAPSNRSGTASATPETPEESEAFELEDADVESNADNTAAPIAGVEADGADPGTAPMAEEPATPSTNATGVQISDNSWELVLVEQYEPNDASREVLDTIVDQMKSTRGMRLKITGINNINKMSRLAQIGANRIANIIIKEANISPDRLDIGFEQVTDIKNIRVRVTVLGGAQ